MNELSFYSSPNTNRNDNPFGDTNYQTYPSNDLNRIDYESTTCTINTINYEPMHSNELDFRVRFLF